MDHITKPLNRKQIRSFAILFRQIFALNEWQAVPVLYLLDLIPNVFPGCYCEIEDDELIPYNIPARCILQEDGSYVIQIKSSIYEGAVKGTNAYLGHICHEICHILLFSLGYTPIYERSFGNYEIPPYESVEWQAKALCGEVMIPYYQTIGLSAKEIMKRYKVSRQTAQYRVDLDTKQKHHKYNRY